MLFINPTTKFLFHHIVLTVIQHYFILERILKNFFFTSINTNPSITSHVMVLSFVPWRTTFYRLTPQWPRQKYFPAVFSATLITSRITWLKLENFLFIPFFQESARAPPSFPAGATVTPACQQGKLFYDLREKLRKQYQGKVSNLLKKRNDVSYERPIAWQVCWQKKL